MDHLNAVENALAKQLQPLVDHEIMVVFHALTAMMRIERD